MKKSNISWPEAKPAPINPPIRTKRILQVFFIVGLLIKKYKNYKYHLFKEYEYKLINIIKNNAGGIMEYITLIFISFLLVFLSELGDKTQLIAISFSSKIKTYKILLGIALGSIFSHGVAIIFGSALGNLGNENFRIILNIIANIMFIIIGLIVLFEKENKENKEFEKNNLGISYIIIIALSIVLGELGDKTFLASIGMGINYPRYKLSLILGSVLGMVTSNFIAIIFGKLLGKKVSNNTIKKLSGVLFLIFGILGLLKIK